MELQEMLWVAEFCRIMEPLRVGKGFKKIPFQPGWRCWRTPEPGVFSTNLLAWNFNTPHRFFGADLAFPVLFLPPFPCHNHPCFLLVYHPFLPSLNPLNLQLFPHFPT